MQRNTLKSTKVLQCHLWVEPSRALPFSQPEFSENAKMIATFGQREGKGLGSELQGDPKPVTLPMKLDRFGVGYQPTKKVVNESYD